MNIESSSIKKTNETQLQSTKTKNQTDESSVKFSEELKEVAKKDEKSVENVEVVADKEEDIKTYKSSEKMNLNTIEKLELKPKDEKLNIALKDMNNIIEELNSPNDKKDNFINQISQSEDKKDNFIKENQPFVDNNDMINNDFNIQDNKDLVPQMNLNMNFSGDGQPFSSFMNNEEKQGTAGQKLSLSAQDLAEESAILSTMAENIAIANKNKVVQQQVEKKNSQTELSIEDIQTLDDVEEEIITVINEEGIKKVDVKTGIKIETIVKYDSIIMNQADVEVFANLVDKGEININNLAPEAAERAVKVSKTLADMLAKSMENNQPLRINFDNNISVIIRISRDGKITADFLPSSQVAEAYLKENLPLLRQRFDDNNIEYESLNQRERRGHQKENEKKKGRNNE